MSSWFATLKLINDTMQKHGLIQQGWAARLDFAHNGNYGRCIYSTKTISINRYYADSAPPEGLMDTILHEIAHANTPGDGHGPAWKDECIRLGCKPEQYIGEDDASQKNLAGQATKQRLAQMQASLKSMKSNLPSSRF